MPSRSRRFALLTSFAIHAVIVVLLAWLWTRPAQRPAEVALKTFDVAGAPGEPAPPAEAETELPVPQVAVAPVLSPSAPSAGATSAAGGAGCDVAGAVQAAILADPPALAEFAAIPRTGLSVANALVLWSAPPRGPATAAPSLPTDPFAGAPGASAAPVWRILPRVSAVIRASLATQPTECLDAPQTGPNFLYLSHNGMNLAVALGTGVWTWAAFAAELDLEQHPFP